MLPPAARLRRSQDFRRVVRRGRRAGGRALVVHALRPSDGAVPRVGLVVGRAVGGAVQRNTVRRRLRHVLADRLPVLDGADVVVRALPGSAGATSAQLAGEVDRLLPRALAQPAGPGPARTPVRSS